MAHNEKVPQAASSVLFLCEDLDVWPRVLQPEEAIEV